jgi:uncharacterized membrane protein YoaK (UPF0700 family)
MPAPRLAIGSVLLRDERQGPLPALLLALTVVTGLVDAVSVLSLGRVFVANMTGNVVFIGFAAAGAPGFSLSASLSALAGFLAGAYLGGRLVTSLKSNRGTLLLGASVFEVVCVATGLAIVAAVPTSKAAAAAGAAAAVATALGAQNAVVRALGVPDLTTTVLTMTLTGLAADVRHGFTAVSLRRILAVLAMFAGAVIGGVLVLRVAPAAGLGAATAVLIVVALVTWAVSRSDQPWQRPGP